MPTLFICFPCVPLVESIFHHPSSQMGKWILDELNYLLVIRDLIECLCHFKLRLPGPKLMCFQQYSLASRDV